MLQTSLILSPKPKLCAKLRQTLSFYAYSYEELLEEILSQIDNNPFIELQDSENHMQWQNLIFPKNYNNFEELPQDLQTTTTSLKESLYNQLLLTDFSNKDKYIAYTIIESLEDNGYLKQNIESYSKNTLERVRKKIQQLEPLGCASTSLQEYLLLQLNNIKDKNFYVSMAIDLITNKINLLERHAYDFIMQAYDINEEKLNNLLHLIKTLKSEPFTSNDYNTNTQYPDLYIAKQGDKYEVFLYDDYLPKININKEYLHYANTSVKPLLKEAHWFIESIKQRQKNLLMVAKYIINYQNEFIKKGLAGIKPLSLKQVACDLNLSVSTISRLTTHKYISTMHGLLQLKKFFSISYKTQDKQEISADSIKACIANLCKKNNNLQSDAQIAEYLCETLGIKISRRTVAKYRNALHIPPIFSQHRLT